MGNSASGVITILTLILLCVKMVISIAQNRGLNLILIPFKTVGLVFRVQPFLNYGFFHSLKRDWYNVFFERKRLIFGKYYGHLISSEIV